MMSFRLYATAAVAAIVLTAASAPAAFAGPTQTAFLQSFVGAWSGSGKLTGEETGTLKCRMTFKKSTTKVNYTGRCSYGGAGSKSFSGSLSYSDTRARYESSSGGKTAIGTVSGDGIVFNMRTSGMQGDASTSLQFNPNLITFDIDLVDEHNNATTGHVELTKG